MIRYLPLVLGLTLLAAGIAVRTVRYRRLERWVRVDGVTVGSSPGGAGEPTATVVQFTARFGRIVTGTPRSFSDTGFYPTGRTVPVWYDPDNPERFEANVNFFDRHRGLLLILPGALMSLFGALLVR